MRIYPLVIAILFLLHIQSCKEKPAVRENEEHVEIYSTDKDLFPDKVETKYAKNFSVSYHGNYKMVNIQFESEQRKIAFKQKLVLVQRGTPPPASSKLSDAWVIEIPAMSIAANDDGEVMRLHSLGLTDKMIAMGGGDIYDPALRKRWENKEIASIGYSITHAPAPEVMLALNPDLALLYSFDGDRMKAIHKFRQMDVNAIPTFAWAEDSYLGKAEWLKFTALFFNAEEKANEFFETIEKRCLELAEKVRAIEQKKTAFWLYHPYEKGDWGAHRNDFIASYLPGAGAVNVLKDGGPSHTVGINNEYLIDKGKEADVWIVNCISDEEWPPAQFLTIFKSYRKGQVYHHQKRTRYEHNAYDWYETAEVRPDLVLEDLVSIFYPNLLPNHTLFFFEKVKLMRQ